MSNNPFKSEDEINFPCVYCEQKSVTIFNFDGDMDMDDFRDKEYVNDVEFGTFLRINDLEDDEYIRLYKCQNCGRHIAYLPRSGCRYIP